MKTFLKLTALAAALCFITPFAVQAQNGPPAFTPVYTNYTVWSASGSTTQSTKLFSSPFNYSSSVTYSQLTYIASTLVFTNPSTGTFSTNNVIEPSIQIVTNTAASKKLNLVYVKIQNNTASNMTYAWLSSSVASNAVTNGWSVLSGSGSVTYNATTGIPLGDFNAVEASTGTVSLLSGAIQVEIGGQ
jgi:hypothetical protein